MHGAERVNTCISFAKKAVHSKTHFKKPVKIRETSTTSAASLRNFGKLLIVCLQNHGA